MVTKRKMEKTAMIIRLTPKQREIIEKACELKQRTRSSFIRYVTLKEASKVIKKNATN